MNVPVALEALDRSASIEQKWSRIPDCISGILKAYGATGRPLLSFIASGFGASLSLLESTEILRVEFLTDVEQLSRIGDRWEALNRARGSDDVPFFQSFAWCRHVARVRLAAGSSRLRLSVAAVWRGDALIGVWPLVLVRTVGSWIARNLDDPFGQFAGVVAGRSGDVAQIVESVMRALRPVADGMLIEAVIGGSALQKAMAQHGARSSFRQQAVFVDLHGYASFKDFEQDMKGDTRRRLRNRMKRLRQAFDVRHHVVTDRGRFEGILGAVYEGRRQWLLSSGRASPAFSDRAFKPLIDELPVASGIELLGFVLALGDEEISQHWGFIYAGRYYWYMSTLKEGYEQFSPGLLHLGMIIEGCIERGLDGLELMPPASRYKLEWSDQVRDVETMIIPFTLRGQAVLRLDSDVMPAARRLARALPDAVRRPLARLFTR